MNIHLSSSQVSTITLALASKYQPREWNICQGTCDLFQLLLFYSLSVLSSSCHLDSEVCCLSWNPAGVAGLVPLDLYFGLLVWWIFLVLFLYSTWAHLGKEYAVCREMQLTGSVSPTSNFDQQWYWLEVDLLRHSKPNVKCMWAWLTNLQFF